MSREFNLILRLSVETDDGQKIVQHLEGFSLTRDHLPFRVNDALAFASAGPSLLTTIESVMINVRQSFRGQMLEWSLQKLESDGDSVTNESSERPTGRLQMLAAATEARLQMEWSGSRGTYWADVPNVLVEELPKRG
jgi:hypothetical protein